ncbi:MAG: VWA domain-containing protein [Clostridiaceae bacterium]|nr:VWA domain-containing protein [Clostridiaceae bacterium]
MKKNITELIFILDRSGSMAGLESDTIGGFNAMLERQKNETGDAVVTTVLFDDRYELLHDRIDIRAVRQITDKEYYVRGSTALLDAIGYTIGKIANVEKQTAEEHRADRVMFVITTDGLENASHEYTYEKVRDMIRRQKEKYGWEFIFLGANIDAVSTAASVGINADRAANFVNDSEGISLNYKAVSEAVSAFRSARPISDDWKKEIDNDYKKRGGRSEKIHQ